MKNSYLAVFFTVIGSFLFAFSAKAICPICTVAVGAGVGFSRWLGVDYTVTGLWIGGLTVSIIMWTIDWIEKKKILFKEGKILTALAYYAIIVIPLYWTGIMGHPFNKIWGIDKLLVGIVIGSATFFAGGTWYYNLKAKNGGHAYFPFQKVVMPVSPLIVLSFIFYLLTK